MAGILERRSVMASQRQAKYAAWCGFQCANPHCVSGTDIEAHHIIPLSKGGPDCYWNLVSLCHHCHMHFKRHRDYAQHKAQMNYWKCLFELARFGLVLDEQDYPNPSELVAQVKNAMKARGLAIPEDQGRESRCLSSPT